LKLLGTNPGRPDGEHTVRIRVKNIPLSVDDGLITRTLILKELDVVSEMREKRRVNGRLTNCETGDRLIVVKASTVTSSLPRNIKRDAHYIFQQVVNISNERICGIQMQTRHGLPLFIVCVYMTANHDLLQYRHVQPFCVKNHNKPILKTTLCLFF